MISVGEGGCVSGKCVQLVCYVSLVLFLGILESVGRSH